MKQLLAYDEKELLAAISRGDEMSFKTIYDHYHQRIHSLSFFLTRSHALSEDMTQEIFVKIWVHREDLPSIHHFDKWIRVLVRNHAYNYLNRMAREKRLLNAGWSTEPSVLTVAEDAIADKEFTVHLKKVIEKLPPQQKIVYILSRQDGLKLEAIAERMGLSINTVKNHLKAALSTIRVALGLYSIVCVSSLALLLSYRYFL